MYEKYKAALSGLVATGSGIGTKIFYDLSSAFHDVYNGLRWMPSSYYPSAEYSNKIVENVSNSESDMRLIAILAGATTVLFGIGAVYYGVKAYENSRKKEIISSENWEKTFLQFEYLNY